MQSDTLVDPTDEVVLEGHDLQAALKNIFPLSDNFPSLYVLAGHLQFNTLFDPEGEVPPSGHRTQGFDPP